jgi:hypothetical protein
MATANQITKPLRQILEEQPDLRLIGIRRGGAQVEVIASPLSFPDHEMLWCGDAWSVRVPKGRFQQFMIFLPIAEAE